MPVFRPNKPASRLGPHSHFLQFCIAIWEYLFNGGFPFIDTDTVKVTRGPGGYAFQAFPPSAGGGKGKTIDANYKLMAITGFGSNLIPPLPDLLICSTADASTIPPGVGNDTVYVAKARTMRRNTTEFFADNGANVTQKYTYFGPATNDSSFGDNFRSATDNLNTEVESAVPRYCTVAILDAGKVPREQSFIYVVDLGANTGVVDPKGGQVTKLEVLPVRMWSKVVNA